MAQHTDGRHQQKLDGLVELIENEYSDTKHLSFDDTKVQLKQLFAAKSKPDILRCIAKLMDAWATWPYHLAFRENEEALHTTTQMNTELRNENEKKSIQITSETKAYEARCEQISDLKGCVVDLTGTLAHERDMQKETMLMLTAAEPAPEPAPAPAPVPPAKKQRRK